MRTQAEQRATEEAEVQEALLRVGQPLPYTADMLQQLMQQVAQGLGVGQVPGVLGLGLGVGQVPGVLGQGLGVAQVPAQMPGQQEAQGQEQARGHAQQQGGEQVQEPQGVQRRKRVQGLSKEQGQGQGQVRGQVQVRMPMHPVGQNTAVVGPGVRPACTTTVSGATVRLT